MARRRGRRAFLFPMSSSPAVRPLAIAALLALAPLARAEEPRVLKDVAYGPHKRNKLDITIPQSDKPLPLLIWVHGGGWAAGDKSGDNPALLLMPQGYAVAAINYRLSQQAIYPAQLHDCQQAVRFLREHAKEYNLDPEHFGVWGASAGGHLVALLGTTSGVKELDGQPDSKVSDKVQAVCDWFGPTDLAKLVPPDNADNVVAKLVGGPLGEKKKLAATADPVNYLDKNDAPLLIVHGTKDPLVPLKQSEYLNDAAKKAGVPSELIVIEGGGHGDGGFIKGIRNDANKDKTAAFFAKYLKPAGAKTGEDK